MKILITGGAGFVGSRLALDYRDKYPGSEIIVFDNLKRRGSELNLEKFKTHNVKFIHGDIRVFSDFEALGNNFDLFIEASAEPSVHAGLAGEASARYVIDTNLSGTVNCLEFAKKNAKKFIFLSTSRVYSIPKLVGLPLEEKNTRLHYAQNGISEEFSTGDYRSFYGTTKLASELLIQEYVHLHGLNAVINRCGVICGAGQFGKIDQGVFTLWVVNHYFKKPLKYTGFGGTGKQVRDLLHPKDLFNLIEKQVESNANDGSIFNIGGGDQNSVSLQEWTKICQDVTGNQVSISSVTDTAQVDVPYYVSNNERANKVFSWTPQVNLSGIAKEIQLWIKENELNLKNLFS